MTEAVWVPLLLGGGLGLLIGRRFIVKERKPLVPPRACCLGCQRLVLVAVQPDQPGHHVLVDDAREEAYALTEAMALPGFGADPHYPEAIPIPAYRPHRCAESWPGAA